MRTTWDETWMSVGIVMRRRSPCVNRQVGAVLVDRENRIISVGYNGFPRRMIAPDSCATMCPRATGTRGLDYGNCIAIHAEVNAIINASVHGRGYGYCTLYVTSVPCIDCAKVIANAQVGRVVLWENPDDGHYDSTRSIAILRTSGVDVEFMKNLPENPPQTS